MSSFFELPPPPPELPPEPHWHAADRVLRADRDTVTLLCTASANPRPSSSAPARSSGSGTTSPSGMLYWLMDTGGPIARSRHITPVDFALGR
jgi:hypothetical protein